jgi:hypothetical protein
MNPFSDVSPYEPTSIHRIFNFITKPEQHSFCTALILAPFGVKLAYGVKIAGNRRKQKA